ncbi:hypothetical protein [Geomonas oryzae]|uniref:hypothetical protein n=1 Tax=Geomonas oryzae TaxID=2364273 RepID=UPI00100BA12F|nr:hypothetical protein [Geomonas oryzae]
MAKLIPAKSVPLTEASAYYQYRRLAAKLVRIGHYQGRELYHAMQRPSVRLLAEVAVQKYFHRDDGMKVQRDMRLLLQALLVMLPLLARVPGSMHPDQHRGHVLSWLRIYVGGNARRRFISCKEVPRTHNPALLEKRLEAFGIHDRTFTKVLVALFRAYYWRETASGRLARTLFDPIMIETERDRHSLRIGNCLYSLHKHSSNKGIDLNRSPVTIFDYNVRYDASPSKIKVTITLSSAALASFKAEIRRVIRLDVAVDYKIKLIRAEIKSFAVRAKWAKDSREEIMKLRKWLWRAMQPLMMTMAENEAKQLDIRHVPNILVNEWLRKRKTGLVRAKHNVFYDLRTIELRVFLNFLSPYREEV